MRRVAITGAGTVNPLAQDVPGTYSAFKEGRTAIGLLDLRDFDRLSVRIGAQIKDWQPEAHFDRARLSAMDRFSQFAVVSARQALLQSGLDLSPKLKAGAGVILGTAGGGMTTSDESYRSVYEEGKNRVHPLLVPRLMHNAAAAHVSMEFGLAGPGFSVSSACASSNHAMALAFQMVRSGAAPVILTGGSEAMLCFGGIKAWEGLRVMSSDACRPFSKNRSGMVQGEGAAVFVFEDMEHAMSRGATILAEVAGCGLSMDAGDLVSPSQEGAARAMRAALQDAAIDPHDIGYINAHGTGTTANDRTECSAIVEVFGPEAMRIPVSSTKSMHGHLIGGTGAVELLACLMALREGILAPTAGFQEPDPDCPLDVVPNHAREANVTACLSNAFAFGGMNAVLALRRS
ncbi:beta-ketoacyl-[acyl-carrier-protein] synthase family protein [Neotabrizicola shimadae]|uniref:Nodulation protein E n=1 Tax=Neotabrizicola shimadae TaxID=2807096 RepID=A0A8G0ZYD4_9RHOB|nr:beta-ketoacyl-[acyl-carrier-protein] synthase family protein [Neotabrizicola shimadae]QYZ71241.1 beta-ketoacyl-[acyl-carrier-protein] synthase family protein [Neotabrizicola shimadae]